MVRTYKMYHPAKGFSAIVITLDCLRMLSRTVSSALSNTPSDQSGSPAALRASPGEGPSRSRPIRTEARRNDSSLPSRSWQALGRNGSARLEAAREWVRPNTVRAGRRGTARRAETLKAAPLGQSEDSLKFQIPCVLHGKARPKPVRARRRGRFAGLNRLEQDAREGDCRVSTDQSRTPAKGRGSSD